MRAGDLNLRFLVCFWKSETQRRSRSGPEVFRFPVSSFRSLCPGHDLGDSFVGMLNCDECLPLFREGSVSGPILKTDLYTA